MASNSLNLFSNLPAFVNQKSTTCNSEQTTCIFMIHIWNSRLFSFSLCGLTHVSSQETKRFLLTSVYLSCSCSKGGLPIPWRCTQDPPNRMNLTISNIPSKFGENLPSCFLVMQQQRVSET